MTIRLRTLFFVFLGVLLVWFLYIERHILTPFVIAGIFAYICNPVVNFFSHKVKLPRTIAVIVIYVLFISAVVIAGTILGRALFAESSDIRNYLLTLQRSANSQINALPDWLRPDIRDILTSLQKAKFMSSFSLLPFFPQAISRLIGFLIFIFSGFYFLQDGGKIFEKIISHVPGAYKVDVEILFRKINKVLGGYLRGQIFLVVLMSLVTYIALLILGVRFALAIGIFSGLAEIVPLVGPITAASVAVIVALLTGSNHFALPSYQLALIIIALYFVLRHLEDYFVIPHVMGRITKLPPFIIFFSVVAGGHVWGILGLILAVPIAAVIRLLLEFSLDRINAKKMV